jgi:uncharacterized Zn finger protein
VFLTKSVISVFSRERVARLGGQRVVGRALLIRPEFIEDLNASDNDISATVRGTLPYYVKLWVGEKNRPAYSCTCPQGDDGKFCKHCAAVALLLHEDGISREGVPVSQLQPSKENDSVLEFARSLGYEELLQLVLDAATRDDVTALRLVNHQILEPSGKDVNDKEWRQAIDRAFGSKSRFVDYRAAPRWASGVGDVLEQLNQLIDGGGSDEAIALFEHAFTRAELAVQYVDDSDGWITDISLQIADMHLRACQVARPKPKALARRLAKLELDHDLDTFRGAAQMYASILGAEGLVEYRRVVTKALEAMGSEVPGQWSSDAFRVRQARIGVALGSGDVDELISILDTERLVPWDCATIVDALARAGRDPEAIEWARRGLASGFAEHQLSDLRARLSNLLVANGDLDSARDVRLAGFRAAPAPSSLHEYLALFDEGERDVRRRESIVWLTERTKSRTGAESGSELVAILLFEGEIDDAFLAAQSYGCRADLCVTIARAIERTRPVDAIALYQPEILRHIGRKTRGDYVSAVSLLSRVRQLYVATDDVAGWDEYVTLIATSHRAKTSLMAMLREKKWLDG